jgi:hypothetical protein
LLYSQHSVRGGTEGVSLTELAHFSFAPRDFLSMLWPWAVGFGGDTYWGGMRGTDYPQYVSGIVVFLSIIGWPRRGERNAGAAWIFIGAAILSALIALGIHLGGIYVDFLQAIPFFSFFRVAVATLIVAQLSLALLSGRGLERILSQLRLSGGANRFTYRVTWTVVLAALLLALLIGLGPLHDSYKSAALASRSGLEAGPVETAARNAALDLALRAVLLGAALVVIGAAFRKEGLRRVAPVALVGLIALDLGSVGVPILKRAGGVEADLERDAPREVLAHLAGDSLARVIPFDRDGLFSNKWVSWRIRSIGGAHGAVNRAWDDLRKYGVLDSYAALCALGVRYMVAESTLAVGPGYAERLTQDDDPYQVWRLLGGLPLAYAVPRLEAPGNTIAILTRLRAPDFNPTETGLVSRRELSGEYPGSRNCSVSWIANEPDRLVLETQANDPAFLVVADAYFPGWRAEVNGDPTTIYRVNHLLRGIRVPAGVNRIRMTYVPEGWSPAVTTTRLAWTVWVLLALGFVVTRTVRLLSARGRGGSE